MNATQPAPAPDCNTSSVRRRFRRLLTAGAKLRPAGSARNDPDLLLRNYMPRCLIELFDATFYLSDYLYDDSLGFFVGFLTLGERSDRSVTAIYPRIFYKDSSLIWRAASHYIADPDGYWVGKGDVRPYWVDDDEYVESIEETTNLPYEVQAAFDMASRAGRKRQDDDAIARVLRRGPPGRVEPYADFTKPRSENTVRINRGRRVARFLKRGDPASLRFARGYEPDLTHGVVDESISPSRFFGGEIRKFRVLSANKKVQYMFFVSPTHAWLNPPQALTRELSTYGVRLVDVEADEDVFVPGYEYHEVNAAGEIVHSQIPDGFAGEPHEDNEGRADAGRWTEALPIIKEFRKRLL